MVRALSVLFLALWFGAAGAQQMEIIELRSKTVDEVLPVLLPLVEPGGTLTGMNNQLFLRASSANRDEIKRVLAAIDAPARRLIIRIATDRQSEDSARGAEASGEVAVGKRSAAEVRARVWDTRSARNERAGQMMQTVNGGRAFINVGRSLAAPLRQVIVGPSGAVVSDSVVFRDLGSGFYATPRVNGQRVTLEINQQAERPDFRQPGGIDSQRLSTTVDGRLGEWIELGGAGRQASGQQGGFSVGTAAVRDSRSIWLKVEEAE